MPLCPQCFKWMDRRHCHACGWCGCAVSGLSTPWAREQQAAQRDKLRVQKAAAEEAEKKAPRKRSVRRRRRARPEDDPAG